MFLSGRRELCSLGVLSCLFTPTGKARASYVLRQDRDWQDFLTRYVREDGRVVDTGNGGISHSEGQGYAMLLATYYDDQATFRRLWSWTKANLQGRRRDALLAWRFRPGGIGVDDLNNATDGDVFVAASLMLAFEKWNQSEMRMEARRIAHDILRVVSLDFGNGRILMPGHQGFIHNDRLMWNPSYHSPQLLPILNRAFPDSHWAAIARTEKRLVDDCRFGPLQLVPDWIQVHRSGGSPIPHPEKPTLFGYDAIRVPLMAAWASDHHERQVIRSTLLAWERETGNTIPATIDVRNGERSRDMASPGMASIRSLIQAVSRGGRPWSPQVRQSNDYYSSILTLLSRACAKDAGLI